MNGILNSNPKKNLERNIRDIYNLTEKEIGKGIKIARRHEKIEITF